MAEPIKIKGQITHPKAQPNEVYITAKMPFFLLLNEVRQKTQLYENVLLHSSGAANYNAMKVAVQVQKMFPQNIKIDVQTRTINTHDFIIPSTPDQKREIKSRNFNAVDITLTKI